MRDRDRAKARRASAAFLVASGVLCVVLTSCTSPPTEPDTTGTSPAAGAQPAAAPAPASTAAGPPRLELDTETIDFGVIGQLMTMEHVLTLTNTGGDTLVIEEIKTT